MKRETAFWITVTVGLLAVLGVLCLAVFATWGVIDRPTPTPEISISATPSDTPTKLPTETAVPTVPSATPTQPPTAVPTDMPTVAPSETPTQLPTATPSPSPSPTWPAPYVVERGDHLWGIAERFYGVGGCWFVVWGWNRTVIEDPGLIYKGERFWLPQGICGG